MGVEAVMPSLASRASIASLALECWPEWETVATESVPEGLVRESKLVGKFVAPNCRPGVSHIGVGVRKRPKNEAMRAMPMRSGCIMFLSNLSSLQYSL